MYTRKDYRMSDINIFVVIGLIVSHFIGDFILQSDKTAKDKSKSNAVLGKHVLMYGIPFLWLGIWFYVITVVLHFIIDYFTSRASSYMYNRDIHWFFVIIGFDQMLHMISLVGVLYWIGG